MITRRDNEKGMEKEKTSETTIKRGALLPDQNILFAILATSAIGLYYQARIQDFLKGGRHSQAAPWTLPAWRHPPPGNWQATPPPPAHSQALCIGFQDQDKFKGGCVWSPLSPPWIRHWPYAFIMINDNGSVIMFKPSGCWLEARRRRWRFRTLSVWCCTRSSTEWHPLLPRKQRYGGRRQHWGSTRLNYNLIS